MATITATATSSRSGDLTARIQGRLAELLSDRLKNVNVELAINNSIKQHDDEIADLNTEQLNRGLKADGGTTGDYFNIGYKGRLRPVDLYDTGDYHKSAHAVPFGKAFSMEFSDPKSDELKDRYGDDIEGLTKENIREAAEIIKPTVLDEIRKQL